MIEELRKRLGPEIKENEPMAPHTTFKVGGPAQFFLEARSAEAALAAARTAEELAIPFFVFGGGSNILVSDEGVKGLVVMMANRGIVIDGGKVTVEAGAPSGLVAMKTAEAGLSGFEWAAGLPGTIGGAIRGNAGMFGGETGDSLVSVRVMKDGAEQTLANADCQFAYRDSVFKKNPGAYLILSAEFRLEKAANPGESKALLKKYLLEKKDKQPVEFNCAGCIFMNWKPAAPEDLEKLRRYLDLDKDEQIPVSPRGTVPAGFIIDRAQLKGTKMGHVSVSEKHGNFFVSDGKATASEIIALIGMIKTRLRDMTHALVTLQEEVEYVGF